MKLQLRKMSPFSQFLMQLGFLFESHWQAGNRNAYSPEQRPSARDKERCRLFSLFFFPGANTPHLDLGIRELLPENLHVRFDPEGWDWFIARGVSLEAFFLRGEMFIFGVAIMVDAEARKSDFNG